MRPRKKKAYFERIQGVPEPIVVEIRRRVRFSEVDPMGVVWYGRYALYFEEASEAIGRLCGLSYRDFLSAELRTPIVAFHVDYFKPLILDEEFTIKAALIWHEGACLNTEYHLLKQDGSLAVTGYTVQLFVDQTTWGVCLVSPDILEECRRRWKAGEFRCQ